MKISLEKLNFFCIGCADLCFGSENFCDFCLQKLDLKNQLKFRKIDKNSQHAYLFNWSKNDRALKRMVYFQKGSIQRLNFYKTLLEKNLKDPLFENFFANSKLVVCPPKKLGAKDHAFYLSEFIASRLKLRTYRVLYRPEKMLQGQRHRSRGERRKIEFATQARIDGKIIFIDDVLTTGASFQAAKRIFQKDQQIQCFSLFYRELAGEG